MQKRFLTAALSVALFSLCAPISMVHAETSFVIRIPTGVKLSPEITILLDARETLPVATVGASYRFDFRDRVVITGESSPDLSALSWSLLSPAPMGLALSADGVLSGVPLDEGTKTLELAVTYKGKNDTETFVIEVVLDAQIALSAGTPPAGLVGVAYAGFDPRPLLAVSGDPSFNMEAVTWSLKAGSVLPQGLALDPATGLISGTPSAVFAGPVALVANYKDVSGERAYAFTIDLNIAVSLAVATAPQGIVGQAYAGFDPRPYLTVTGDPDFDLGTVSWSVAAGTLPEGLSLNASTGVISGTPAAAAETNVSLRASYKGRNGTQSFSLVMMGIQVALASSTPPAGVIGQAYAGFDPRPLLSVTGDPDYTGASVTWSVKAGSSLPDGLVLNPATGVVSGTPTAPFSDAVPLVATYRGVSGEQAYTFTVKFNVAMSMSVASAPQGVVGVAYPGFGLNDHLTVSGDPTFTSSAVTWSVASGTLPAGLTLNAATGVISGTPTAVASSAVTFRATYSGSSTQGAYSLVMLDIGVSLEAVTAPEGVVGVPYAGFNLRDYLAVTGDASFTSTTPITWGVASGTLPTGLSLNTSTGVISGTPTASGTKTLTLRASYKGKNGEQSYSLVVRNITLTFNTVTPPEGTAGMTYQGFDLKGSLTISGDPNSDVGNVAWSIVSGTLPAGIALNANGTLTGTPTVKNLTGSSFDVKAAYKGKSITKTYKIIVAGAVLYVTQISSGSGHTCAVTVSGGAMCWGSNNYGQLGNGTTTGSLAPVFVSGLSSGVAKIAASDDYSCAVTTGGAVKCWGENSVFGRLGNNSTTDSTIPVNVSTLSSGVSDVSLGETLACAVTTGGAAKCWGGNTYGQLGDGKALNSLVPVGVSGLSSGVNSIAAGSEFACALTTVGAVKCWGSNSAGQLGDNTTTNHLLPATVSGMSSGVAMISAGYQYACAVTSGGAAKCWGYNNVGQLGNATVTNSPVPVGVSGLSSGVANIATAVSHSCAVTTQGAALCWGSNGSGQLGNGEFGTSSTVPIPVSGLSSGVASIEAGNSHTCARSTNGAARCWGSNASGRIGDGTTSIRLKEVYVRQ